MPNSKLSTCVILWSDLYNSRNNVPRSVWHLKSRSNNRLQTRIMLHSVFIACLREEGHGGGWRGHRNCYKSNVNKKLRNKEAITIHQPIATILIYIIQQENNDILQHSARLHMSHNPISVGCCQSYIATLQIELNQWNNRENILNQRKLRKA